MNGMQPKKKKNHLKYDTMAICYSAFPLQVQLASCSRISMAFYILMCELSVANLSLVLEQKKINKNKQMSE